jgi:hypothetical protein
MAEIFQNKPFAKVFGVITKQGGPGTGSNPSVLISKAGGAPFPADGAVTELGNGLFRVDYTAADTDTIGDLVAYVSATNANDQWFSDNVVLDFPLVQLADGVAHGGPTATLSLKSAAVPLTDGSLDNVLVTSNVSVPEALRYLGAVIAGDIADAGSGNENFADWDGNPAVSVVVDATGNRTVTLLP